MTHEAHLDMKSAFLDVAGLEVRFGKGRLAAPAVKDVSFHLMQGESVGLVGESGSGKSTVLKAIAGLAGIAGGSITLTGRDRSEFSAPEFARHVQLVFQDPYASLHPRHTIMTAMREVASIHRLPDQDHVIASSIEQVGLAQALLWRYPNELSGGQRQRVAIARALLPGPQLVLLDEPTSALDVSVQAEILNLLSELKEQLGLSFLLVSHDLAVISHMCSRIIVMNRGEVTETASASQIRTGRVNTAYARELIESSRGYSRHCLDSVPPLHASQPASLPPKAGCAPRPLR